MLKMKK